MIAAIYNRVSTEKQQQEGLSLQTQREACIKYAQQQGYEVPEKYILDEVYSGLTLNRPNLNNLLTWVKKAEVQAIVIYSTDRFSRDGYDLLTLIRDCEVNNAKLLCVSEDLGQGEVGQLINFVKGWASGLEAARTKERTARGRLAKAKEGRIVAGFGVHGGYFGYKYEPSRNSFSQVPGQIDVAKEILERYGRGESSIGITKDLQSRGIRGPGGNIIYQSTVNSILTHAEVYAGVVRWKDIVYRNKLDPIISAELALAIAKRRQLNKEHSHGFGRRKWFSGRVFCGVCGKRYVMRERHGCTCNGASAGAPLKCKSPTVPYRALEKLLAKALLFGYSDIDAVVARAQEVYQNWQMEMDGLELRQKKLEHSLLTLTERKRRISYQHEMSFLSDDDFIREAKTIMEDDVRLREDIAELERFKTDKPIPANPDQIRRGFDYIKMLGEMEPYLALLGKNPERHKRGDQLANALDFKATILPDGDKCKYKVEVRVNLPLETPIAVHDGDSAALVTGSRSIVTTSS